MTLFSEWIYHPFQITGLSSSSGVEARGNTESESGKTNQSLETKGSEAELADFFSGSL